MTIGVSPASGDVPRTWGTNPVGGAVHRCRSSVPGVSLESQHGHQTVLGRESSANVGLVPSNLLLVHLLLKRQRLVGGFRLNPCRICRGLRLRVRSTTCTLGAKQSTED